MILVLEHPLLVLGLALFCVGLFVTATKKNFILMLIGIELMLNGAFVTLSALNVLDFLQLNGQIFIIFGIVLAAAGAAVALAIILNYYRNSSHTDPTKSTQLKEINHYE
ncbi:MAG: NADH-quinone oxidoreductase subunit K [Sphingobacteriales bacterium]|jgi:NADH-quinone oxidoreductase subunit K